MTMHPSTDAPLPESSQPNQRSAPEGAAAPNFARTLEVTLKDGGLHEALQALNARARFRFTGAYRFDPPHLRNLSLFDRENPFLEMGGDINMIENAFCSIVHATGERFATEDATKDERVLAHPARRVYVSYCGVPLRSADGAMWGVLCYFDFRPRLMADSEMPTLDEAASTLGRLIGR